MSDIDAVLNSPLGRRGQIVYENHRAAVPDAREITDLIREVSQATTRARHEAVADAQAQARRMGCGTVEVRPNPLSSPFGAKWEVWVEPHAPAGQHLIFDRRVTWPDA